MDLHVAFLVHANLFLANRTANVLGLLYLPLAYPNLFLDDLFLFYSHLFLGDRDADRFALPDIGGRGDMPFDRPTLDDDLFPLDWYVKSLVFRDDFLVNSHFACVDRLFASVQFFLVELHGLLPPSTRRLGTVLLTGHPNLGRILVVRAISLHNGQCFSRAILRLDGNNGAAGLEFTFIVVGLLLRHAHADQGADDARDRRSRPRSPVARPWYR